MPPLEEMIAEAARATRPALKKSYPDPERGITVHAQEADEDTGVIALYEILITYMGKTTPEDERGIYYTQLDFGRNEAVPEPSDGGAGMLEHAAGVLWQRAQAVRQAGTADAGPDRIIVPGQ